MATRTEGNSPVLELINYSEKLEVLVKKASEMTSAKESLLKVHNYFGEMRTAFDQKIEEVNNELEILIKSIHNTGRHLREHNHAHTQIEQDMTDLHEKLYQQLNSALEYLIVLESFIKKFEELVGDFKNQLEPLVENNWHHRMLEKLTVVEELEEQLKSFIETANRLDLTKFQSLVEKLKQLEEFLNSDISLLDLQQEINSVDTQAREFQKKLEEYFVKNFQDNIQLSQQLSNIVSELNIVQVKEEIKELKNSIQTNYSHESEKILKLLQNYFNKNNMEPLYKTLYNQQLFIEKIDRRISQNRWIQIINLLILLFGSGFYFVLRFGLIKF